jgi:hypothetical protein
MFGNRWTVEQKKAYRGAFSLGRLVDELWGVIAILWTVVFITLLDPMIQAPWDGVVFLIGFSSIGLGSYRFLPAIIRATMPQDLREALPEDRFAGPSSPGAPRTYRELLRRWVFAKGRLNSPQARTRRN